MISKEVTEELLNEWRAIWLQHRGELHTNRKSGAEVIDYLENKYQLTEIFEKRALDVVTDNVILNNCHAEKLPKGMAPNPRAFYVKNAGVGKVLYRDDSCDLANDSRCGSGQIFVGIDIATGFFLIEGSSILYDELLAFQGLEEKDLENFVCVAQYILALKE